MATASPARTPGQVFALVFGLVYLAVGIVGFFVTGLGGFAEKRYDEELLIFALNPLHNVVHLGLGVVWIGASARPPLAKQVNLLFGLVLGLVTILGLAGILKFLAIEDASAPDNFLHLATALLAIYFGTAGAEGPSSEIDI
jgi:nitroreductase